MLPWLLVVRALAEEPASDRDRIADLVDDTVAMTSGDRTVYLQALVNGGRESGIVTAGLVEAIRATASGAPYEDAYARAVAVAPARSAPPLALPALDHLDPKLLGEYRRRYYAVRTEIRTTTGASQVWSTPPYTWGGPVMVNEPTITTSRTWAVYEGDRRLDVPEFLALAGRDDERRDLVSRITMKRWLGRTYYAAAVGGVTAVVFSAVAVNVTGDPARKDTYEKVGATGLAIAVVGLIGGSVPTANASRLETEYALSDIDIGTAGDLVAIENDALRAELGLSPLDAAAIEGAAPASVTPRPR